MSKLEELLAELNILALGSPPDDWVHLDADWYLFCGYGKRGDLAYVDEPDDSNKGDLHGHGQLVGRWRMAKKLRELQAKYGGPEQEGRSETSHDYGAG